MRELEILGQEVNAAFHARENDWSEARWRRIVADPEARIRTKRRSHLLWVPGALMGACAAAALLFLVFPNALERGTPDEHGQWLQAQTSLRTHEVDDGSTLTLTPGAAGRLSSDPERVRFELTQGDVEFHVNPARKRPWKVYAGPLLIEVVGTVFHVDYDPGDQSASVRVERGVVRVTGPGAHEPVRLEAGDSLEGRMGQMAVQRHHAPAATEPENAVVGSVDSEAPNSPTAESVAPSVPPVSGRPPVEAPDDFRLLYKQGKYREALADAKRIGIQKLLLELDAHGTWALADTARLGGDMPLASQVWNQLRQSSPGSILAARAAFMLGRQADKANNSSEAERLLQAYLAEQPSDVYSSEATGRLMDVYRRTGRAEAAKGMASRYLKLAPRGAYGDVARSLMIP
jgi:TolA-binding protein